jgi:hypothetical protein
MSLHAMFVEGPTWETTGLGKKMTNGLLSKSSSTTSCHLSKRQSWGYHTPMYMLNHIIRLQAVKIVTKKTARTLNLLTKQSTKMHNASYQKFLALDYLLASEEDVCKKFNLNNCCLQINNKKGYKK